MRSVYLRTFCVFVLCVSGKAQSPCPSTFVYEDDEFGTHGVLTIRPNGPVSYVNLKVNLTVAARLPTSYFGTLEPVYTDERSLRRGDPIKYHVHFPISRPLPLLTSVVANGKLLCYGPGDIPGPYNLVTTINLEHVLTVNSGTGANPFATDFIIPDDLPNELFEKPLITKVQTAVNNIHIETASGSEIAEPRPKPVVLPLPPPAILKPDIRPSAVDFTVQQPNGINPVDRIDTIEAQCGLVRVTLGSRPLVLLGEEYVRGAWPWVVAIFKRNAQQLNYICSGSLVSERHVISAAHCLYIKSIETKTNELVAKVGAYDLDDLSDDIAKYIYIEKATAPDSYDPNTLKNDIIILTLKKKVVYNEYISPVCLWSEDRTDLSLIVNKRGVITGWGVKENGEAGRGKPRRARIPVVSTETCRASRAEFYRLTSSTTFCAGDRNGTGPCNGDSGGGLYMKEPSDNRWKLRGVVSLSLQSDDGEYECNVQQYIIFTDVAKYLPWIKSILSMA